MSTPEMKEDRRTRSIRRKYKIAAGLDVAASRRVIVASEANEQARQARLRMAEEMAKIDRALEAMEADTYTIRQSGGLSCAIKKYSGKASGVVVRTLANATTREALKKKMAKRFPDHLLVTHHVGYTQIVDGRRHV
jgi:hypothetical protein